jgi:Tol biopolymer transport system component
MFEKFVDKNEREFYTMDKEGNNIQLVAEKVTANVWTWPSPDGRRVAYREGQNLKLLSLEDNTSKTLVRFPEGKHAEGLAWSPDGQNLVWSDGQHLKVISVTEGESRTLVEANENQQISGLSWSPNQAWSPDGKMIAYALQETLAGSVERGGLWIISTGGGTPKNVAEAPSGLPVMNDVIWHPDGDMIFVTGYPGKGEEIGYEHWVIENFLPEE